jgi:hypothetical protein
MSKRAVWAGIAAVLVLLTGSGLVAWRLSPGLPPASGPAGACELAGIHIAPESLAAIYEHPETILEDPASFWATDPAYRLLSQSPWIRGGPVPPDGWLEDIERVAARSERRQRPRTYARSAEIRQQTDTFCTAALPVIADLLPDAADISTTVYLTALTDHSCFAYRGSVVMDTSSHSPTMFFNVLGHELLHIGYFGVQPYQTEVWTDNYATKVFLTTLQNDGLAVYVQQLLSESYYPVPLEMELLLLNNKLAVRYLTRRVNALMLDTIELPPDEVTRKAFGGVNQRALYTVGAHMARTIDEELGREALVRTVAEGPRSFVAAYNRVAKPSLRIVEIPLPATLSPVQQLRDAALKADYDGAAATLNTLRTSSTEVADGAVFEHLSSTGLILLRDGQADLAVDVFELMTERFPDHPDGYLWLAETYDLIKQPDRAQEAHQRALDIDPAIVAIETH